MDTLSSRQISSLEIQEKIKEMQTKLVLTLVNQEFSCEKLSKISCEDQPNRNILKIQGVSFNLSIPPKCISEDISSPLDNFLLHKKKHMVRPSPQQNILRQLTCECDL